MPLSLQGTLNELRAHDLGTGFGPPNDFIDVEAVAIFVGRPGGLGFQLRNDENLPARQAMFDLLRDGFATGGRVAVDFDINTGASNGIIRRVTLLRRTPGPPRPGPPPSASAESSRDA